MESQKREYVSEKEYVLYLSKGSGDPDGFVSIEYEMKDEDDINPKQIVKLSERIADATRFTSVEANRVAMEYHETSQRYPFKLKISNYKDLVF